MAQKLEFLFTNGSRLKVELDEEQVFETPMSALEWLKETRLKGGWFLSANGIVYNLLAASCAHLTQ